MKITNIFTSILNNPQKTRALLRREFKSIGLRRSDDYRKFIVLSRSRTGSNLLVSYLNSHANIKMDSEIFVRLNGSDYRNTLKRVFRKYPKRINAVGFKIFYYHPVDEPCVGLWQDLIQMEDLYVIHLKRDNVLRTLLSRKIAAANKAWTSVDSALPLSMRAKKVSFSAQELEEGFNETKQWEKEGEERFKGHPLLSVTYEDLVADPEDVFSDITAFLGVSDYPPKSYYKKQNPEKASDLIVNYQQLKDHFTGTVWEPYFSD